MTDHENTNGAVVVHQETMPAMQSASASIESSRAVAEIQASMLIARQFPRSMVQATRQIIEVFKDKRLAEDAEYEYPKGGKTVSGLSIRAAEILAREWGNMRFGFQELARGPGFSEVRAYCIDLQTNVGAERTFTQRHIIDTQGGGRQTRDEREVYELIANMAQRRVRAAILNMIPADVQRAAQEQIQKTILDANAKTPLKQRVRKTAEKFESEWGITVDQLEVRFGKKIDAFTERDWLEMGRIGNSIKDGMSSPDDWFSRPGDVESLKERMKKAQSKRNGDVEPPEEDDGPEPEDDGDDPSEPVGEGEKELSALVDLVQAIRDAGGSEVDPLNKAKLPPRVEKIKPDHRKKAIAVLKEHLESLDE